ncbi:MAG: tetratricopeptide repeat protein [Proteobacteria bacterium]|nr:tetratricopeptide repeat protein [Pseudomonadota bacterium]
MSWVCLLAAVGHAQTAEVNDFRSYIDQAKFFIKRKWYDDALKQLEEAVEHEDGRIDPEAWYMLATVRYELCDIEGARTAASRAHSYSRTDEQLQEASGFSSFLETQFGIVSLSHPQESIVTHIDIELESLLFDPGLKEYINRLGAQLHRNPVLLPYTFGLPTGKYKINGVSVDVSPSNALVLEPKILARGPLGLQLSQIEFSTGISAWFGPAVDNLLPAPNLQLAITQPVGQVKLGLMIDWAPRPFSTRNSGIGFSPTTWSFGLRAGWDIPGTYPLVVRPSLGYRFGQLPGVEIPCAAVDSSYICEKNGSADMYVYGVGQTHVILVEVATHYLELRMRGVGVGVKAIGEYGFGHLPARAEGHLSKSSTVEYTVARGSRVFHAFGLRMLFNLSIAL